MEHRTEQELRSALDVLAPLFESLSAADPQSPEAEQEGTFRLRSRPFLLETPEGSRSAVLEVAGTPSAGWAERLWRELYLDELTGACNRRYLRERLPRWASARRSLGLVMLDLWQFKRINDTCGHLAGDRILREVAAVLRAHACGADSVVRLGGDEFLVLFTGCTEALLRRRAEELRGAVEAVTPADFGCAYDDCFDGTPSSLERLMDAADRQMYAQKRQRTPDAP